MPKIPYKAWLVKVPIWPFWRASCPLSCMSTQLQSINLVWRCQVSHKPYPPLQTSLHHWVYAAPGGPWSASSAYPCLFKLDEAQEAETYFAWPSCRGGGDSTKLCVLGRAERIAVRWMVIEGETMQPLACDRAQLLHSTSLNRRIAGGRGSVKERE